MKTHTGEKSNKCIQCDYAYSQASQLRRHLKTHYQEEQQGRIHSSQISPAQSEAIDGEEREQEEVEEEEVRHEDESSQLSPVHNEREERGQINKEDEDGENDKEEEKEEEGELEKAEEQEEEEQEEEEGEGDEGEQVNDEEEYKWLKGEAWDRENPYKFKQNMEDLSNQARLNPAEIRAELTKRQEQNNFSDDLENLLEDEEEEEVYDGSEAEQVREQQLREQHFENML